MPRVFISHATADRAFVEREVVAALSAFGVETWYCKDDIKTGEEWERSIHRGLHGCDWFLIVLSRRSLDSPWVRRELHWAMEKRQQRIVPVLIEDCDLYEFHLGLGPIQCVDFRARPDEARRRLLHAWAGETPGPNGPWENSVGMPFARIKAGTFMMGSDDAADERPAHRVTITRGYSLGVVPVTQRHYQAVTGLTPSHFRGDEDLPVEQVSWFDAVAFCNALSLREGRSPFYELGDKSVRVLAGDGYRLPTEAEWERACRAGDDSLGASGPGTDLDAIAWHRGISQGRTWRVGLKAANAWGLHDMLGNVWEWCQDGHATHYYLSSPEADPPGPPRFTTRCLRGGGWGSSPQGCRSSCRGQAPPEERGPHIGFRVAVGD